MPRTIAVAAVVAATALLLATVAVLVFGNRSDRFAGCGAASVAGGSDRIGGPFTLVREDGVTVDQDDVIDGLTLIYFGYTYCPDVCPVDVARNADAVDLLADRGIDVTPVMVTVDPERDTPEVMADFTDYMHPRMIGLTGSPAQIDAAKKAFAVYGERRQGGGPTDYLVDHTVLTYLMAPEAGLLTFFRRDATAEDVAESVACFAERL